MGPCQSKDEGESVLEPAAAGEPVASSESVNEQMVPTPEEVVKPIAEVTPKPVYTEELPAEVIGKLQSQIPFNDIDDYTLVAMYFLMLAMAVYYAYA
jgi:hypothetical protein